MGLGMMVAMGASLVGAGPAVYNVADFGAQGQDVAADTTAFGEAVKACVAAGGGTVYVPPGRYTLGRVTLGDRVTLHLEAGAEIHPSTDPAHFPPLEGSAESAYKPAYGDNAINCRYAVFYALGARDVTVEGRGCIVGDGKSFWDVKNTGEFPRWNTVAPWFYYGARPFRPILVMLEECDNALVRDVRMEDASCYTGWFAGCRDLRIQNITVRNDPAGPNTDGFHFSSCRNVHISDCDFVCGDDCIAIDPNHHGPSDGFVVRGCTFHTTVNVFRIYTGLDTGLAPDRPRGSVSDIAASNCAVVDASGVFNVTADGGDIRRLSFTNFAINMDLRGSALFLLTLSGGSIGDVSLANMTIRTDGAGTISGEGGPITGVALSDLQYLVCPRTKVYGNALPEPVPGYGIHHFAPYNLNVRHARDLRLSDIRIDWGEADLADLPQVPGGTPHWPALECRDVEGLDVDGLVCRQFGEGAPAVLLTDVRDATFSRCRAEAGCGTFLELAGACANVALAGSDLTKAAAPSRAADGVPPGTLVEEGNRVP